MPKEQIGRLAMRVEGKFWNAYYALTDTMDDAILLGSIGMVAVTGNPDRKDAFVTMMRDVVSDILEEKIGVRPDWGQPHAAPEHERAGSA